MGYRNNDNDYAGAGCLALLFFVLLAAPFVFIGKYLVNNWDDFSADTKTLIGIAGGVIAIIILVTVL